MTTWALPWATSAFISIAFFPASRIRLSDIAVWCFASINDNAIATE
jgi:hypothetical protein